MPNAPESAFVITVTRASGDSDIHSLEHQDRETLLECFERSQVESEYHCRDGFCGACRCKLIRGNVEYVNDPLAFIDDDEILPCCTRPSSDIEVELP